jgi:hypothetical protein
MSGTNSAIGFPTGPLVDSGGNLTPVWRQFLVALYNRTGAAPGVSAGSNASALAAETAARMAADSAEASARSAGDAALQGSLTTTEAGLARLEAAANGAAAERLRALAAEAAEATARADGDTAAHILGLSFAAMPAADPGGFRLWQNAGAVWVGPYVAPLELEDGGGYWLAENGSRMLYG